MKTPAGIVGPAYRDDALPASAQECINWVPVPIEAAGGRSNFILRDVPGLTSRVTVGTGPIRGARNVNETLFVVSGTSLYSIDSNWTPSGPLGTVAGTGRVSMAHNFSVDGDAGFAGAELVIVNGTQGYVWNTATSGFSTITDPDWVPARTVAYQGQYIIFDTPTGFQISVRDRATSYEFDFETAQVNPDAALSVLVDHEEVWVFGPRSIEIFQNTGNTDFPYERNAGATIERGLGAIHSAQQVDNSVFWLADNGIVYRAQGYTPERISWFAIEQDIKAAGLADWFGKTWVDGGATYYAITHPNGKSWVYDASTGQWHRRKSYLMDRWRANCVVNCYGYNIVGDYENGTIWTLDDSSRTEGTQPLIRERVSGYVHENQLPIFYHGAELVMNTGNASLTGTASQTAPVVELRYSDDFGRNWSNWKTRSLGLVGQYAKIVRFGPLGRSLNRLFHVRVSDPIRSELVASTLNVSVGTRI